MTPATHDLTEAVRATLSQMIDPETGHDIITSGLLADLRLHNGRLLVTLNADARREPLRAAVAAAVARVAGAGDALVILTQDRAPTDTPPAPSGKGTGLAQVRRVIAISSAKGGVGKSTVTVNLAAALAHQGLVIGVLDADIYGPSLPRLLGLTGKPDSDGVMITPMQAHGFKALSIGSMVEGDTPMVWRGPMATSALNQLLVDTAWGALDVLLVDMPPGTGDIQLTLVQRARLAGAVIVSTPQDIALIDARKGIAMFQKMNVPIIGLIENMSRFVCPHCGEHSDIFGHGGAEDTAQTLGLPFLGAIPLHMRIRTLSDAGAPIALMEADSPEGQIFYDISSKILKSDAFLKDVI